MSKHLIFWRTTQATFCRILARRYRLTLAADADPEPEPPYIVVANHGNFFDPWLLGKYFRAPLHIMMNDDGFRAGAVSRWYLHGIGAFAKKKGAQDLKAMKNTLGFLKRGEPVLIFPEGQATWDGETQPIYGGIERVVKRARCPLVIVRLRGNFLSRPWWATTNRRGRIVVERQVLPAAQLAELDAPAVLDAIKQGIYHDDVHDPANREIDFAGTDLAVGLERLVWRCMSCDADDSFATVGNTITCRRCNNDWTVDPHCGLQAASPGVPCHDDVHAWVRELRRVAREEVASAAADDQVLARTSGVAHLREDARGRFAPAGRGTLTLTRAAIAFAPEGGGAATRFPLAELQNYVIQKKDVFEITVAGADHRFEMVGKSPMKWLTYVRYLRGFDQAEQTGVM